MFFNQTSVLFVSRLLTSAPMWGYEIYTDHDLLFSNVYLNPCIKPGWQGYCIWIDGYSNMNLNYCYCETQSHTVYLLARIFLEKVPIMATLFLGAEDDFPIDHYSILAHLLQNHHWLRQVAHHGARHLCHQGLLQCPSLFINYMGDLSLHKLETFVVYS